MNIDASAIDTHEISGYTAQAREQSVSQFLLNIIPNTFVGAFAQPNVLQVVLVSLLFAFALSMAGERGRPVLTIIEGSVAAFFTASWASSCGSRRWARSARSPSPSGGSARALSGRSAQLILEFYFVSLVFVFLVLGGRGLVGRREPVAAVALHSR